jgi:hypothetical protein
MTERYTVYAYTCDRCGEDWEVCRDSPMMRLPGESALALRWPHKVHFPSIHDGTGKSIHGSKWDVCDACWDTIRAGHAPPARITTAKDTP